MVATKQCVTSQGETTHDIKTQDVTLEHIISRGVLTEAAKNVAFTSECVTTQGDTP